MNSPVIEIPGCLFDTLSETNIFAPQNGWLEY